MSDIKRVLLVGLGAVGSIYATQIQDKNCKLSVLVDSERLGRYIKEPLDFNGEKYDFDYILPESEVEPYDLILIATKAKDFNNAAKMIKGFVGEKTVIFSLLNGISSEDALVRNYGADKVLYSFYVGHASVKEGRKVSYDGEGELVFGEKFNEELSEKVLRVKDFFDNIGINYQIPEDMQSALWRKFVMNVGINQTSAILQADYSQLQKLPHAKKIALGLMSEAVVIADKMGVNGCEMFVVETFNLIDNMPSQLKPSMLQDIEAKRQTEVDIFAAEVCKLGKKYGVPTPKNEFALSIIRAIDSKNVGLASAKIAVY